MGLEDVEYSEDRGRCDRGTRSELNRKNLARRQVDEILMPIDASHRRYQGVELKIQQDGKIEWSPV